MPKDISSLSKRRQNQLIHAQIARYIPNRPSTSHQAPSDCDFHTISIKPLKDALAKNVQNDHFSTLLAISNNAIQNNVVTMTNNTDNINVGHIPETAIPMREHVHQYLSSSSSDSDEYCVESNHLAFPNTNSLADELRFWIAHNNASHGSMTALLKILRKYGHSDLPTDVRTLMNTPRSETHKIREFNGGSYVHFELEEGLKRSIVSYFPVVPDNIEININCDGLPLFKSSRGQFWPILVSIETDFYTEPVIVGIYYGNKKPADANLYLREFIVEAIEILGSGLNIDDHKCHVSIKAVVCDAPAKAFLTYTKSHNGYFGCYKCVQEGNVVCNRTTFPEINCDLRTDYSFRHQQQPEHHRDRSDLLKLNIGMVTQVALDYMHLVCLGVTKRLLQFWIRGPKNVRLTKDAIHAVSEHLESMKRFITTEIFRKPRSLDDIDRWKATELRQFLLYTGSIVLQSVLPKDLYNHFLAISIAIRILSDKKLCVIQNNYARSLLRWVVTHYGELYSAEHISYNVHNLVHLADDVLRFGCLDSFSAFKFENCLQGIKKKVKNSKRPLHQIVNRIKEENSVPFQTRYRKTYPVIHYSRFTTKIERLEFDGFSISRNDVENCCQLNDHSTFIVTKIFNKSNDLYIRGYRYTKTSPLFLVPCNSEQFSISLVDERSASEQITMLASRIQRKYLKINHSMQSGLSVVIPLLQYNY